MKPGQKLWTREELILAINLYCKLPFGRLHSRNPEVVSLAKLIGRTPGSVAFKLVNFASLDPQLKARGIKGAANASNLDKEIWNEFFNNWDNLFIESEKLYASRKNTTVEELYEAELESLPALGREKERIVRVRLDQAIFRTLVMANYDNICCMTGIDKPELLIASHIVPWSKNSQNRLNPKNGLALNALHDRAFDHGLITVTEEYRIKVSPVLLKKENVKSIKQNFIQLHNKLIRLPKKFLPDPEFLKYHNHEFFKK
jgi:putative restriction endonuclease